MGIYTSAYLKQLSRNNSANLQKGLLFESISPKDHYDIFLSHSFLDKLEVEGLYLELVALGFSVYVDWISDPETDRTNVNKATSILIRQRMRVCKSLLLAVSINASHSKWMPWELGYMDAFTQKCAIIPVSRDNIPSQSFKGYEYLSLYPYIKKIFTRGDDRLFIIDNDTTYVIFDDWFSQGILPFQQDINILNY